ncbi:hypothetical protein ABT160_43890, partial [Streptomyces sp. NPDC001941]
AGQGGDGQGHPFAAEPRAADHGGEPAPPERRAGDHGGADLLPALAARVLGTPVTVVTGEGREQLFLPHGGDPAAVKAATDPVLFSEGGFFHAALTVGSPVPVTTALPAPASGTTSTSSTTATNEGTTLPKSTDATPPARPSHTTAPWLPPTESTAPRYRLAADGVLTAPDGATYTQGTPGGRGNGFFHALSQALGTAARELGATHPATLRLHRTAGAPATQLMRQYGLPGRAAERDALFDPPPLTPRTGAPAPSRDALDGHLRRYLATAPWGPGADRALAEWAASATGTTVTLVEENGTTHTYPGPGGDSGPHVRLRRRGGDFVPLLPRTPAPPPVPTPKPPAEVPPVKEHPAGPPTGAVEEEAFDLNTLSGADTRQDLDLDLDLEAESDADASDVAMDLDTDFDTEPGPESAPEDAAVRTGPEQPFAARLATLLDDPEADFDALLDVVRRRNQQLGGLPDVAFDSAFTDHAGIGLPEALDQAEQDGRLDAQQYEELRDALGLGTDAPFRQTRPTGTSARDRAVTLRMLDRVARLVKEVLRKEDRDADARTTPHVAVALLPDGSLGIAGNTGAKAITSQEADLVRQELAWFVTGEEPQGASRQRALEQWDRDEATHRRTEAELAARQRELDARGQEQRRLHDALEAQYETGPWDEVDDQRWNTLLQDEATTHEDRKALADARRQWQRDERWLARKRPGIARERRDRTKLRALVSGWYRLYHPDSPELDLVRTALAAPRILNIGGEGPHHARGSEHGELTILGHWVRHWEQNPGDPAAVRTLPLGGFKMACASCDLAYRAVNEHVGPTLGHRVEASGTHGIFFPGWRMPDWMRERPALLAYIRDNADDIGAYLDHDGVLQGEPNRNGNAQMPPDSASEYASDDASDDGARAMDTDQGSPRPESSEVGPRLPRPGVPTESRPSEVGPRGARNARPRFVVRSAFDARRRPDSDGPVTELTVRVALRGSDAEAARVRENLRAGVRRYLNDPANHLPNGDRLTVSVEFVDATGDPHLSVDLVGRERVMDQVTWWADADPLDLAHELSHQLGLRDEYRSPDAPHRPDVPGSLLGDPSRPPEHPSLAAGGLRDRHLALLGALIGDDVGTEPVTRRSVWVDPVSLPRRAEDTTPGAEVPARAPQDPAAPAPPEPEFVPFTSGNFEFTNLKHTNEAYRDKAVRIVEVLRRHDTIRDYLGGRPCRITLMMRTMETPANVRDLGDAGVEIELASHYFENYGIGHVMGMLAHEIGLHPLASRNTGIPDEEAMFAGFPLPVPGLEGLKNPRSMNTEGSGQADHIMAAFPSSTRHRTYRDIVVGMARIFEEDAAAGEARPSDVTDLFDCYLMDLASIAVTNDHRARAATEPGYTARSFNAYKDLLAAVLEDQASLLALLPGKKTLFGVVNDFGRMGTSVALYNRGDSIQRPG